MTSPSHWGIDVPGVRAPSASFVHATVVASGADAGFTLDDVAKVNMYVRHRRYREPNRKVRNEVPGDRRPALTVLVTDHWDERWLVEIEVVAARPPSAPIEDR